MWVNPPASAPVCTIAQPASHVTVEARVPDARLFCSLVGEALFFDVLHAPLTKSRTIWHYKGATVTCRLRYKQTRYTVVIRNSTSVCRWFTRGGTGWHRV
jgi:hypothetical protein